MYARGSKFLKVVGILMIIGGGFGIVGSVGLKLLYNSLIEQAETVHTSASEVVIELASSMNALIGFAVVVGLIELAAGIIGCMYCNKPEKAVICLVFGILVLVTAVASSIYSAVITSKLADYSSSTTTNPISAISSMLLPILYIVGAVMNKQSVQTTFVNQTPDNMQFNQPYAQPQYNQPVQNMNMANQQAAPAMAMQHQDTADSIFGVNPSLAARQQAMQAQQAKQQGVDVDARDTMDEVAIPSQADIEKLIQKNK